MEVSTDFIESEKVGRPCRFGQNLPLRAKRIQPENLSPFTSVQGRLTAAETSDRRKSRCNKKRNSIQTVGNYRSVCCSDILWEGYFLKHEEKGRRQTALPPEKSIRFFDHLPISALVRPDSSECPIRFQPGNLLLHSLGGYPYPFGKCRCAQRVVL